MKTSVVWKSGMEFDGVAEEHTVPMDAKRPIGKGTAPTPKELVAMGLAGCTAMDVVALLKKYKQLPEVFRVETDIQTSTGINPAVFLKADLTYFVEGNVEVETLLESVRLSQTKYCGVSAMLAKAFPIAYRVLLNGTEVGTGNSNFETI